MPDARQILERGVEQLEIELNTTQFQQLLDYTALMQRWNKTHNLTTITSDSEIATLHFLDSLAIAPWVSGATVLDVGAGAGLPSIPLAITFPHKQFLLVDSSSKRIAFLQTVKATLGLANMNAQHARIEDLSNNNATEKFDHIVCRAFSSLQQFVTSTRELLNENGNWLAMKGQRPSKELQELPASVFSNCLPLSVPGLQAERHLIVMMPETA